VTVSPGRSDRKDPFLSHPGCAKPFGNLEIAILQSFPLCRSGCSHAPRAPGPQESSWTEALYVCW
jgi:hypothetical protein